MHWYDKCEVGCFLTWYHFSWSVVCLLILPSFCNLARVGNWLRSETDSRPQGEDSKERGVGHRASPHLTIRGWCLWIPGDSSKPEASLSRGHYCTRWKTYQSMTLDCEALIHIAKQFWIVLSCWQLFFATCSCFGVKDWKVFL